MLNRRSWTLFVLVLLLLVTVACTAACTPGNDGPETEASTAGVAETPAESGTEPAPVDPGADTASDTVPETTEPAVTMPPFEVKALPAANVAREGFVMASHVKYVTGEVYSNVNANDGDLSMGYSNEWGADFDPSGEHYLFIDLTERRAIDSLKLYPLTGDEGGLPTAFDVLISDDGKTYEKHTAADGITPDASGATVDMGGVEAKYIKLVFTAYGPGDAERGVHISIGELEVYSPIDNASNMQLNLDDIWLFKDPDTSHQLAVTYYRDGTPVDPERPLYYESRDPEIAVVSEDGLITPVSYGTTEIYVYDGVNRATCAVEVKRDVAEEGFLVSSFFITYYVYPDKVEEAIDLMVKSGVTHLEAPHWWDHEYNDIHMYALHLCRVRGATYTPNDENGGIVGMTDEQIIEQMKPYENRAGFMGMFLTDEPSTYYTEYARVFRVLQDYNPHYFHYLNLLPIEAYPNVHDLYVSEFAACAGGARRLRYLSLDYYPFGWGNSFGTGIYGTLETVRLTGLMYNADTGFYMQSQIMPGNYDALTLAERRYSASMAIAYGMKNIKHYLGLCPVNAAGKPDGYTSGILKPDITPADYYDDIVEVNAYYKAAGKILNQADALEVYHSNPEGVVPALPESFFVHETNDAPFIYSVFREIEGTQQYVVLTNKRYNATETAPSSFVITRDVGKIRVYDPMTDKTEELTYTVGESFPLTVAPGLSVILLLEDGVDVRCDTEESENLALGCGVFATSSKVDFWNRYNIGTIFLTDGIPNNGAWLSDERAISSAMLDLGCVQNDLGRMVLGMNEHVSPVRYPKSFTVEVSVDGTTFTQIADISSATYDDETKSFTLDLGGTDARYIRITLKSMKPTGIGEWEVYRQESAT